MGNEIKRYLKVDELRKELRRLDGDLIVRFRDGDVKYPGVYVMRDEGMDHVCIGSPYPVRDRLAEIDHEARKLDGRRPPSKPKVWVLIRRYEWESQAQQTECCDTFVFRTQKDALAKASSLVRSDVRKYGWRATPAGVAAQAASLANVLTGAESPRCLVQLTDGDNVVYELYRRTLG